MFYIIIYNKKNRHPYTQFSVFYKLNQLNHHDHVYIPYIFFCVHKNIIIKHHENLINILYNKSMLKYVFNAVQNKEKQFVYHLTGKQISN